MRSIPSTPLSRLAAVLLLLTPCVVYLHRAEAQADLKYQLPPKAIVDLVDTRPTPVVDVSPKDKDGRQWLLIEEISGLPSIADLAQPELRLAGLRFNPKTNGPSRGRYITGLKLKMLTDGTEKTVTGLPPNPKIRFAAWSPDARACFVRQYQRQCRRSGTEPVGRGCGDGEGEAFTGNRPEWNLRLALRVGER